MVLCFNNCQIDLILTTMSKPEEIREKIINLAKKNPKGISAKDITSAIPEISSAQLVTAINELLQQELFDLFSQGDSYLYRYYHLHC